MQRPIPLSVPQFEIEFLRNCSVHFSGDYLLTSELQKNTFSNNIQPNINQIELLITSMNSTTTVTENPSSESASSAYDELLPNSKFAELDKKLWDTE